MSVFVFFTIVGFIYSIVGFVFYHKGCDAGYKSGRHDGYSIGYKNGYDTGYIMAGLCTENEHEESGDE